MNCILITSTAQGFFKNEEEMEKTLENIEQYAGSFVKAIGVAFRLADNENRVKLIETFTDYFTEYRDWGKK